MDHEFFSRPKNPGNRARNFVNRPQNTDSRPCTPDNPPQNLGNWPKHPDNQRKVPIFGLRIPTIGHRIPSICRKITDNWLHISENRSKNSRQSVTSFRKSDTRSLFRAIKCRKSAQNTGNRPRIQYLAVESRQLVINPERIPKTTTESRQPAVKFQ